MIFYFRNILFTSDNQRCLLVSLARNMWKCKIFRGICIFSIFRFQTCWSKKLFWNLSLLNRPKVQNRSNVQIWYMNMSKMFKSRIRFYIRQNKTGPDIRHWYKKLFIGCNWNERLVNFQWKCFSCIYEKIIYFQIIRGFGDILKQGWAPHAKSYKKLFNIREK